MGFHFAIVGNQQGRDHNPIPYHRTTQRAKWRDADARRYWDWKVYILQCFIEAFGHPPRFQKDGRYRLDVDCHFVGENHGDPENIRKGIQDALFIDGDKHVWGTVSFQHVQAEPGVEIWIEEL